MAIHAGRPATPQPDPRREQARRRLAAKRAAKAQREPKFDLFDVDREWAA